MGLKLSHDPDGGLTIDDRVPFGKYEGREMAQVLENDAEYLKWILDNTDIEFCPDLEYDIELKVEDNIAYDEHLKRIDNGT